MPGIPPIYEPDNKDINDMAKKELDRRLEMIDLHWRYYDGDHNPPLNVVQGEHDYNIILNMCDLAVDKLVEFIGTPELMIQGGVDTIISDDGKSEVIKTPEQELLELLVKRSKLKELLADTLTSGAISGHNFWRIVVDEDDNGEMAISEDNLPYLALLDPRHVTVFYNQFNRQRLYYRLEWKMGETGYRQDIVPAWLLPEDNSFGLTIERGQWAVLEFIKHKNSSKFEFLQGATWLYPFPPIIDWKTRRRAHSYYGDHDMKAIKVNDGVNLVVTNTSKVIYHHGHPKTVMFGAELNEIETVAPDELWTVGNENARMQSIEMQSDLVSSMNLFDTLRNFFYTKMRVMDTSTIKDRIGQITNFGVQMLYDNMIKNAEDRRERTADDGLSIAFKRLMLMFDVEVDDIEAKWSDPLPMDRGELVKMVETEHKLGITSDQTLSKELGRDYIKEQEQLQEEQNTARDNRVASLISLAQSGGFSQNRVNGG